MNLNHKDLDLTHNKLIEATYKALSELGGSGTNEEICNKVINMLSLTDEIVDLPHLGNENQTELQYRLAWARTYLKNYGAISNSGRSVWSITNDFLSVDKVNSIDVIAHMRNKNMKDKKSTKPKHDIDFDENDLTSVPTNNEDVDFPDEIKPWKLQLAEILHKMDPFAFERLSKRVLRECGFVQVDVTKKTGDGGIDGTGKLRINGIFSFNVAFQCKRYKGMVGPSDIRDFRGSLTTDIEKGILITTGTFSKAAREEATNPGKQQIDLIDGEEFITKLADFGIGVREVKTYDIDEEFFEKI